MKVYVLDISYGGLNYQVMVLGVQVAQAIGGRTFKPPTTGVPLIRAKALFRSNPTLWPDVVAGFETGLGFYQRFDSACVWRVMLEGILMYSLFL